MALTSWWGRELFASGGGSLGASAPRVRLERSRVAGGPSRPCACVGPRALLGLRLVEARLGHERAGGAARPRTQEQAIEEAEAQEVGLAGLLAKWKRRRVFPITFYGI